MDKLKLDLTAPFRKVSPYQVKLLFKQLIQVSLVSNIAAIFITIVLWPVANHRLLLIWLSSIFIISAARILLVYCFKKRNPQDNELHPWRIGSLIMIVLAGVAWGSIAYLYDFNWPPMQQFSVIAILFIVALGAVTAYATILSVYVVSLVAIMGPVIVVYLLSGVENFLLYGAGLLLLVSILISLAKRYHDLIIKEIGRNLNYRDDYNDLKSSHDDLKSSHNAISLELEEKETEEKIARAVYTRIAKLQPIDKYGIKGMVEPMGHFSGDFIYYALTPEGSAYVLFADFSGHGLQAALGAIPVSSIFYSMAAKGIKPEEIIKELNVNLHARLSTSQFCCACFIALNPERTSAEIWNGGIPDIFLIKDHDQSIEYISSNNIPLGIEVGEIEETTFETIGLSKGDILFAYTDGVTEASNESDEEFGSERLEEHVIKNHQNPDLLDLIKTEIDKHSKGKMQEDDISMLEIRC